MTHPPPVEAWVIEAEADLILDHRIDTQQLVETWLDRHALPKSVAFGTEVSGEIRRPGEYDTITLPGHASPDQIEQLATQLARAFDTRVFVRRATDGRTRRRGSYL